MTLFFKIWYWLVVIAVLTLAAGITTMFPQTNDVPAPEETKSLDAANKIETTPKAQLKDSASSSTIENVDPAPKIELQHLFNDLRKEYLDTRDGAINWWLQFITIVLAFFGIVVVILGYFGIKNFRELEARAEKSVEKIEEHLTQSEVHLREMTSIDISDPEKTPEIEKAIQDVQSDPDPSFIDKVLTEIYTLQRNGRVEEAVEKWRSITNIAEGIDNNLASRAWLSIAHLLPEGDDRFTAYDKAMDLNPDYTRSSRNQPISKYSKLFHDTIAVEAVLRYFNEPKFEKFSIAQEDMIGPDRYRADVVLYDEEGQLAVIVECKVDEYIARRTIAQFKEYFKRSDAQFGLLTAGTALSKWTFFRILEDGIIEITRSQFEEELVESGSF